MVHGVIAKIMTITEYLLGDRAISFQPSTDRKDCDRGLGAFENCEKFLRHRLIACTMEGECDLRQGARTMIDIRGCRVREPGRNYTYERRSARERAEGEQVSPADRCLGVLTL